MRAGTLLHKITVERATTTLNAYGAPQPSWSTFATLRAHVMQASTEEFIRAHGASSERVVIFRTRWLDGITLADRVMHDGRPYELKELKEIGRRKGLEIRTVARGA